jgi:Flp pilus assembly protein CpaB
MSRVLSRPLDTKTVALSVAGVLAVGTGLLTFNYLASVGRSNAPSAQRTLLVAARPIRAHTAITAEMLTRVTRPSDAVDPDALVVPASAIGSMASYDIPAGSQITASKLMRTSGPGLPGRVHVGMRAVSIALDRVKGVSNLIQAGDRVDVIAVTAARPELAPVAATIIRGAQVLSIGQMTEPGATPSPDGQQYSTATLEVTPKQADMLALSDINATLRLALRSPRESLHSQPVGKIKFIAPMQLRQSAPAAPMPVPQPAVQPQRAPVAQTTPKPISPVAIIDGSTVVSPGTQK